MKCQTLPVAIQVAKLFFKVTASTLKELRIYVLYGFQTADLHLVYKDSSPTTPLIFVLSQGTDPAADLYKFAEEMRFGKKLSAISLGQGQVGVGAVNK